MSRSHDSLRVVIDARLVSGTSGGVEQTIIGLAHGLSRLSDGNEEYLFLAYPDACDWIRPYLSGPCRILESVPSPREPAWKRILKSAPLIRSAWHVLSAPFGRHTFQVPVSDGTIERAGADLVHFTVQTGFLTNVPSIYSPLDLQHLHLPELFTPRVRMARERTYRTLCNQASMVVALSSWGKRDLVDQYQLTPDKVQVVPYASALEAYGPCSEADLAEAKRKWALPSAFIFYPAQAWPHKNHMALLESLALLKKRDGVIVPLVCSGTTTMDFFSQIEQRIRALDLQEQVRFIGFVSSLEMQCLYRTCRLMVFPSKFEGFGMPILEAFRCGVPVACSRVTCLKDMAQDAALLFDPENTEDIARNIRCLWTDESQRRILSERGHKRAEAFSWQRTARLFRAHYRRLATRNLTEEDRGVLNEPPPL